MEIENEKKNHYKDIVLHITTVILPFSLREVSLYFLLHLNEDFDDDLLMEAVDLIAWHPIWLSLIELHINKSNINSTDNKHDCYVN